MSASHPSEAEYDLKTPAIKGLLAFGGGILLGGRDGCYRDLASVHGTYRLVAETRPALELAARWLGEWGVGACTWLLDAPVSNSGRLATMLRAVNSNWSVEVVADPDCGELCGAKTSTSRCHILRFGVVSGIRFRAIRFEGIFAE